MTAPAKGPRDVGEGGLILSPCGYRDAGLSLWWLAESGKADRRGCELLRGHYSRRKPDSPQFMPPGQTIVLVSKDNTAVWGWWRPHPDAGVPSKNGLDGWTCSVFHNDGDTLSSSLILDAELAIAALGYDCGPDGMLTYVWDSKVRSTNYGKRPARAGRCYKKAGWVVHAAKPRSADGKKTLLWKPHSAAGCAPSSTRSAA